MGPLEAPHALGGCRTGDVSWSGGENVRTEREKESVPVSLIPSSEL